MVGAGRFKEWLGVRRLISSNCGKRYEGLCQFDLLDLVDHRAALNALLQRMTVRFSAMEFFGSRTDEAIPACRKEISESDVLIGVYAWRYGWQSSQADLSITEEEFDYARQLGKKCLCYLIDPDHPWPPKHIDKGELADHLTNFKSKVNALVRSQFTTPENLAMQVAADLAREMAPRAPKDSFGGLCDSTGKSSPQKCRASCRQRTHRRV